jgi:hypothetical protein
MLKKWFFQEFHFGKKEMILSLVIWREPNLKKKKRLLKKLIKKINLRKKGKTMTDSLRAGIDL